MEENYGQDHHEVGGIELGGAELSSIEKEDGWQTVKPKNRTLGDFIMPPPGLRKQFFRKDGTTMTNRFSPLLASIEREDNKEIMGVEGRNEGNYERISITVDSGAADTVGPKWVGEGIAIRPTKASKAGMNYKAANGSTIRNYGERRLEGWNQKGKKTGITIQVAEVTKVLGSVGKMTEAGNTIIFSKGRSIITSDPSGKIAEAAFRVASPQGTTELEKKNGVYSFDMRVPKAQEIRTSGNYTNVEQGGENYYKIGSVTDFGWLDEAF